MGLAEELPPEPGLSPDATLTEAFAHFLERHEGEDAELPLSPRAPPSPARLPGLRNAPPSPAARPPVFPSVSR